MTKTPVAEAGAPTLSPRGFAGPGGGRVSYVEAPVEYRGTTVQVCGLWPMIVGSGTPMIGVPIGTHTQSGSTVCFDPINWFRRAKLLHNPSMFVLGLPGLGKSTLVRRIVTGNAAQGITPLILGDLKPDYTDLIELLGGQVIKLGRGLGHLNPLDAGALGSILPQLTGATERRVRAEVLGRRINMVASLITLVRRQPVSDHEETILAAALRVLDEHFDAAQPPLLQDLVQVLDDAPPAVRSVTLDRGDDERYRDAVDPLHRSLLGLLDGPLGETFAAHTSTPIDVDAPAVCIDISGIAAHDERLTASVLMACWNDGFGAIEAANTLADEGLAPQRHFFAVMDELWRVMRSGLVERIDEVSRVNRQMSVGHAYISHTGLDAESLPQEEDRAKARGFIERAGAVVCFGLPRRELAELGKVVTFSESERRMISEWSTPGSWDHEAGEELAPPGQGNCLIKVGQRPGIPTHVDLTAIERNADVHNTNRRW